MKKTRINSSNKYNPILINLAIMAVFSALSGCASSTYRFANTEPVEIYNDKRPIPVPRATEYEKLFYTADVLVRQPAIEGLKVSKISPSEDVNSMDEVFTSSWFTPRLGYQNVTPEELLKGPEIVGPPEPPITVVKAKVGGGNPGFIIADVRGKRYLMKFDPPEFPAIETTTALIVNRLFWGFGYNVPEDYLYFFNKDDLRVDPKGELRQNDVENVLSAVAVPQNGIYRSTVSLLIDGVVLGPIKEKGFRKGDLNDKIPHEKRRILRALKVFSIFTNHTDIRIDNSLDVYVGEPGKGYVKHYFLDFGEAFGGHAAEHNYLWDGFNHYFSYENLFENLIFAGLKIHNWENINYTPWKSVGVFESKIFHPKNWKEVYPYEPIRRSQPADDYWAAKILGTLSREHLAALVKAANYPEQGASEYVIKTLMERRQKVLEYFFNQVSPIDFVDYSNEQLTFKDMGILFIKNKTQNTQYEIRFFNDSGKEIADKLKLTGSDIQFAVPVSDLLFKRANDYIRVDVLVSRDGKEARVPAQFHLRSDHNSTPRLVGIVH